MLRSAILTIALGLFSITGHAYTAEDYARACFHFGNAVGCNNLGVMYSKGIGVRQDYNKANELYRKACDMGNGGGCYNLGSSYAFGHGVQEDVVKALELFGRACNLGSQEGCGVCVKVRRLQGY